MTNPATLPLPPDYVRPTLAEFKAAGLKPELYEQFCNGHEAELRKHYKPPAPVIELQEIREADPLPLEYTRPSIEEFVAAGYNAEVYEAFFEDYEAKLRAPVAASDDTSEAAHLAARPVPPSDVVGSHNVVRKPQIMHEAPAHAENQPSETATSEDPKSA